MSGRRGATCVVIVVVAAWFAGGACAGAGDGAIDCAAIVTAGPRGRVFALAELASVDTTSALLAWPRAVPDDVAAAARGAGVTVSHTFSLQPAMLVRGTVLQLRRLSASRPDAQVTLPVAGTSAVCVVRRAGWVAPAGRSALGAQVRAAARRALRPG